MKKVVLLNLSVAAMSCFALTGNALAAENATNDTKQENHMFNKDEVRQLAMHDRKGGHHGMGHHKKHRAEKHNAMKQQLKICADELEKENMNHSIKKKCADFLKGRLAKLHRMGKRHHFMKRRFEVKTSPNAHQDPQEGGKSEFEAN